jgi:Ca2+-binding EF-hand superfamily protein
LLSLSLIILLCVLIGRIDHMEVRQSLADLGMDINQEEAKKILQRYS